MVIKSFFTDKGVPKTGLTPLITIRRVSDNSIQINAAAMTEVAQGWYKYTYTNDVAEEYFVHVDGTASLSNSDRYQYGEIEKDLVNQIAIETEDDDGRIV